MEFKEIKQDLFLVPEAYFLAHCISADAMMGAGIAVQFRKRFDLTQLQELGKAGKLEVGTCVKAGRVFNLITKPRYWQKPSYETLTSSLQAMKDICLKERIFKLAMPQIGCGLDKLQWEKVRVIIQETFEDTDIEIVVCSI